MMALNRLISTLVIVAVLGVSIPVALAEPESAAADGWHVLESHGGARFRPASEQYWWPARTGSKIPHGSIIATGSSGFLIIARAGESITIRPDSRVELPREVTSDPVRQTIGDLRYRMTRKPDRRFAVETPYLSLLVKGTVFGVVVGARGAEVQVSEGRVRVDAARGQNIELAPGQSARIISGAGAELEFRPEPDSPFVAAPSSRRPIAAAYTNDTEQATRAGHPADAQGSDRSDRILPARGAGSEAGTEAAASHLRSATGAGIPTGNGGRRVDDAAARRGSSDEAADNGPAGGGDLAGRSSGIEIEISEGGVSVDTPEAQIAALAPGRDAESAPLDPDLVAPPEAARPQPHTTAVVQRGDGAEADTAGRPRAAADETTDRAVRTPAGDGGSRDAIIWAALVVLTAALWWRLRRSRHRPSSGHEAAWRWPWQRSSLSSSGSGDASTDLGTSPPRPARRGP